MYICGMKNSSQKLFALLIGTLLVCIAHAQPVANFQANVTQGCAPVIVTFQDLSTGAVSWTWDLGISTSSLQNPGLIYLNPGTYTIRLIVTDANGLQDTMIRSGYLEIYGSPVVDFSVSDNTVCTQEAIQFTDLSNAVSGSIGQWVWDFGDGTTSSLQHPSKVYTTAGSYPVSLTVTNQFGCSGEEVRTQYIEVDAPDVSFTADQTLACGAPLAVQFTSLGDTTGSHFWDFGDGTTSTQVHASHTYQSVGSFGVIHIVTNINGCSDTLISPSYINIGINNLNISARDSSVCERDTIFFNTTAAANSTILWDFGDGDSSALLNPFHVYTNPGNYTVLTQINDPSGCSTNLTLEVEVVALPEVAFTTVDTTLGCSAPFLVDFVDQSQGGVSWYWNFGDGTSSTLQHPSHTYQTVDSFTVSLSVTGQGGCVKRMRKVNYVKIIEMVPSFTADVRGGCAPLDVSFTDTSASVFPITNWTWDFGNGATSTLAQPSITYTDTGYFDVSLIIQNSAGCTDTVRKPAYISTGTLPVVDFVADADTVCALADVIFTNLSSHGDDYLWLFGDGDTAMSYHASHGFFALGDIGVALIMSDRGCRDTLIRPEYVHVLAPLPLMHINDKTICEVPADVQFTNLSVGADYFSWNLGDSTVTTTNHPNHTYNQAGVYIITLTAGNLTTGCEPTVADSIEIKPVVIDMVADTNRGCFPLSVQFSDHTQDAIIWKWNFGTGDSAVVRNPAYSYNQMGYYDVWLTVTNDIYCVDTIQVDSMIQALGIDAGYSTLTPTNGCAPLEVQFQDTSSGTGTAVSWLWDFDDGTTDSVQHPTHLFPLSGYNSISLTVTDGDGCTDRVLREDDIFVTFPIADFVIPHPINCPGNAITFVSNSVGTGLSYFWDFGDGGTASLANPTHTYSGPGIYTVSLQVVDINGCDSMVVKQDAITIADFEAAFTADTTFANCPPLQVTFQTSITSVHPGVSWAWDFGNGASSSLPIPIHNYSTAGVFDVSMILSAASGCADTLVLDSLITIEGPMGSFTLDPAAGCPGTVVDFTGSSPNSISFDWIFGDGSLGSGQTTSHTYTDPGTYFPIMVIQDTVGCEVVLPGDSVLIYELPVVDFTTGNTVVCDSGVVPFIDLSSSADPITDWLWDFGDGNTSTQQFPQHTYTQVGSYTVSLELTTTRGCRQVVTRPQFIQVVASPQPTMIVGDTAGCMPLVTSFRSLMQPGDAQIVQWEWDFGDGGISGLEHPDYTFFQSGRFSVTLIVTDVNGCSSSAQRTIEVYALPAVDFVADERWGCAPKPIQFTDLTQRSIAWEWEFGDGQVGIGNALTHTYLQDGTYDVSLSVTDVNGCVNSRTRPAYIQLNHPVASFSISDPVICPGTEVYFTDESSADTTLQSWQWNFGDGTTGVGDPISHVYPATGQYDLTLRIEDVLGCADSITLPAQLEVLQNVVPEKTAIQDVSVVSNSGVRIRFEAYGNIRNDFGRYVLYRQDPTGTFVEVAGTTNIQQTEFVEVGLDTRSTVYCYQLVVENHCGLQAPLDANEAHCTIEVQAVPMEDAIALSWNAYEGWPLVEGYQVFRVGTYLEGTGELIANLPGNTTFFLDTNMYCYTPYSYRVLALGRHAAYAYSDTVRMAPIHEGPQDSVQVVRATVEDNAFVSVEWELPEIERLRMIAIERNDGSGFRQIHTQAPTGILNQKYQDMNTEVGERAYQYRAFVMDSCGDYTPLGLTGKTVLLTVERIGGNALLRWSPYEGWRNGVSHYAVERYDENSGIWGVIEEVAGNIHRYADPTADMGFPINNYRIIAFEENGYRTSSFSNEEGVVLDPEFFVANAFTPNGDGINDMFTIEGHFLEQVNFVLYNRWGQQIYQSNTLVGGWDGTTFSGQPAPEGSYVYLVRGKGYSGQQIHRSGTITLIR